MTGHITRSSHRPAGRRAFRVANCLANATKPPRVMTCSTTPLLVLGTGIRMAGWNFGQYIREDGVNPPA